MMGDKVNYDKADVVKRYVIKYGPQQVCNM